MRGIQMIYVSPTGATTEKDELVKDLENWFEDHRQMCRLMSAAMADDGREGKPSLERLNASLESGQKLLGKLRRPAESVEIVRTEAQSFTRRIPLSGVNRFDESKPAGQNQAIGSGSQATCLSQVGMPTGLQVSADTTRGQPSRTYLKKSGNGV